MPGPKGKDRHEQQIDGIANHDRDQRDKKIPPFHKKVKSPKRWSVLGAILGSKTGQLVP